jgi:hypothetical protein
MGKGTPLDKQFYFPAPHMEGFPNLSYWEARIP